MRQGEGRMPSTATAAVAIILCFDNKQLLGTFLFEDKQIGRTKTVYVDLLTKLLFKVNFPRQNKKKHNMMVANNYNYHKDK